MDFSALIITSKGRHLVYIKSANGSEVACKGRGKMLSFHT